MMDPGRNGRLIRRAQWNEINAMDNSETSKPTRLIHTHAAPTLRRIVNPPIERASTVLFDDAAGLFGAKPTYGRMGLTVHRELEAALGALEDARHVRLAANGLQACALAIAALVQPGDHVLFPDCAYGPTARFFERRLKSMGVTAERYDPRLGAGIAALIRPATKLIYIESPGSLTFEIADIPAICAAAKKHRVRTVADNTWAAGYFCQPLKLGADISVQALTKYVSGHSDCFGGVVMTNDAGLHDKIAQASEDWGISLSPDDAYTLLRGLRTLPTRLKVHEGAAIDLARWLAARSEVAEVLHPALDAHPDHAIWARDFSGSSGLFGVVLNDTAADQLDRFLASLKIFGFGFSWGGYESLLIPCDPELRRSEASWVQTKAGPLLRVHVGLESLSDLKADLDAAFAAMSPG
jgi:cysteine-S-conjugate beta-lyase